MRTSGTGVHLKSSPIAAGVGLALLAAMSFGITVPAIERAGRSAGPFTVAALLYAGACVSALVMRRAWPSSGSRLARGDAARLVAIALLGAAIAPTLFAWGLQRAGATAGSLLLNLEAFFTVFLARALYREPIGLRVAAALLLMCAGGVAVASGTASREAWSLLGAVAIAGATLAWAADNALTRHLAERDPIAVVAMKAGLGVTITAVAVMVRREHLPTVSAATTLLVCGATGYGLSLRLYLLAQRRMGAARTGSVFALAPFIGAATAWAIGDRSANASTLLAAVLFALAVFLHVTEKHRHRHRHPFLEHDHAHRHDDGHHDHVHDPPVSGEHTHVHRHDAVDHEHEHAPDVHHEHSHD